MTGKTMGIEAGTIIRCKNVLGFPTLLAEVKRLSGCGTHLLVCSLDSGSFHVIGLDKLNKSNTLVFPNKKLHDIYQDDEE